MIETEHCTSGAACAKHTMSGSSSLISFVIAESTKLRGVRQGEQREKVSCIGFGRTSDCMTTLPCLQPPWQPKSRHAPFFLLTWVSGMGHASQCNMPIDVTCNMRATCELVPGKSATLIDRICYSTSAKSSVCQISQDVSVIAKGNTNEVKRVCAGWEGHICVHCFTG